MHWLRVKSKMLAAVAYNRDWQQLYLKYRCGDVYCYWSVPFQKYEEFLAAESKGQYARAHILNCYPYRRVHAAVSTAS